MVDDPEYTFGTYMAQNCLNKTVGVHGVGEKIQWLGLQQLFDVQPCAKHDLMTYMNYECM